MSDKRGAHQASSVRMDVRSEFAAENATKINRHVILAVESEFKSREGKKHYYVGMDVESEFSADGKKHHYVEMAVESPFGVDLG